MNETDQHLIKLYKQVEQAKTRQDAKAILESYDQQTLNDQLNTNEAND